MSQKETYFELCRRLEFSTGGDDRDALIQCLADHSDAKVVRKGNEIQIGSTTIKIGTNGQVLSMSSNQPNKDQGRGKSIGFYNNGGAT